MKMPSMLLKDKTIKGMFLLKLLVEAENFRNRIVSARIHWMASCDPGRCEQHALNKTMLPERFNGVT